MLRAAAGWAALGLLIWAPAAPAAGAPQIGPVWTTAVATVSTSLRAEVSPNGLATTYHFSYLSEAAYQANLGTGKDGFAGAAKAPAGSDPSIGSGSAVVTVAQAVGSLSPDTAYRFRLQATNSAGTEIGASHLYYTGAFGGAALMLDNRGWEMVSPVDKNGGEVQAAGQSFSGGVLQAAAGGGGISFSSTGSFGANAQGAPAGSQYLATRGDEGWATANITHATVAGAYGTEPDGVPYQLFSPDLGRALVFDGHPCGTGACPLRYSLRESAGGGAALSPEASDLRFAGASPDLTQVVFSTCAAVTSDATEAPPAGGCDPAQANLYRLSAGALSLVNLPPAASQGTPGAALAAHAGAVSADGARVYWTLGGNLYLREGALTKQVDAAQGGGGSFQSASSDGAVAFFTKEISPGDTHLFRYLAVPETATDIAGGVTGVLGASAGGDYAYYQDAAGLMLWHGGATTQIAAGADSADPSNFPPATGTARVSADGTHLAFLSKASLTGYDNRGRGSGGTPPPGLPQTEVFLYDAGTGSLTCVSCNPSGEQPLGPSTIPGAIANGGDPAATRAYKPRSLSADGRRLFFDSADDLALQDKDANPPRPDPDVYEWETQGAGNCQRPGGCLNLISRGRNTAGASFVDASASGGDAFFLTADSLVGADTGFADVYDAHEGGGFPEPSRPIECVGDACQFLPSEPEDPSPGTLVPSVGNGPVRFPAARTACKKGFVSKHGKCARKHHRKRKGTRGGAHKRGARR